MAGIRSGGRLVGQRPSSLGSVLIPDGVRIPRGWKTHFWCQKCSTGNGRFLFGPKKLSEGVGCVHGLPVGMISQART